jgi:hypothetical protein
VYIFVGFLCLYAFFATFRSLRQSIILDSRDRVNIIFYGNTPVFLSFGLTDEVNYIMSPSHNLLVQAPGGYGQYPAGSLGRLADIEQKPELIQRAFSSAISGFVDYYIAPKKNEVYKNQDNSNSEPQFKKIELIKQLFSPQSQSNMNFFDKIFISSVISKKRQSDFVVLKPVEKTDEKENDSVAFYEKGFQKKYKGFFFHQSLREEGLSLKLLYYSDSAAVVLSRIIEGEGIRVVDLAKLDEARKGRCFIQHNLAAKTKTVQFLSKQFNCSVEKGDVEGSDIIMVLGSELEEEWK